MPFRQMQDYSHEKIRPLNFSSYPKGFPRRDKVGSDSPHAFARSRTKAPSHSFQFCSAVGDLPNSGSSALFFMRTSEARDEHHPQTRQGNHAQHPKSTSHGSRTRYHKDWNAAKYRKASALSPIVARPSAECKIIPMKKSDR